MESECKINETVLMFFSNIKENRKTAEVIFEKFLSTCDWRIICTNQ